MLKWQFGADTSPFRRGLNDMKSQTKALAGSLKGMLVGALGFSAIIAGFRATFREMDRVHKLGLRFNESAETIQKLDVAARIAGAGLEQVAKAIQTATRNAREARDGVATYADAFAELGIAPEAFINLPMEEKLRELAGALQRVEGDGDKVGLALDVMGRQGAELLPLMKDIESALGENIPVASQRTVDKIAATNDAMTRLGNQIRVFLAESVTFFADFGETAGKAFTGLTETLGFVKAELGNTFGSILQGRLSDAVSGIKNIRDEVKNLFVDLTGGGESQGVKGYRVDPEVSKKLAEQRGDTGGGDAEIDPAAEIKKEEELAKLRDKAAEAQKDFEFKRASDQGKLNKLREEEKELAVDIFEGDEETRLKAEMRALEIIEETAAIKERMAQEEAKREKEREAALKKMADEEQKIAKAKADQAKELREEGLSLIDAKQSEIDSIDSGPRLVTSDLASVGGGGLAALTDTTALAQRQADLQSEILAILQTLPTETETTVEPTT